MWLHAKEALYLIVSCDTDSHHIVLQLSFIVVKDVNVQLNKMSVKELQLFHLLAFTKANRNDPALQRLTMTYFHRSSRHSM